MTIHAYSSFTFSYLNRARVLAETLKARHPDWVLWAIVVDEPPPGLETATALAAFDRVLDLPALFDEPRGGPHEAWLFGHDIVEACTAVKGAALIRILNEPEAEMVFYFDPDIAIFGPLEPLVHLQSNHAIVLTPHQVDPDPAHALTAINDNEVTSLDYGVFNLGFIGVRACAEGRRFARWWADRLRDWCLDDLPRGLFTDQKWCNLVPCFFDDTLVLRDPGYNVASWNLSQRRLSFDAMGEVRVNDTPLRFFHFTKLGPVGDMMTRRYGLGNAEVFELWAWYRRAVQAQTTPEIPPGWWHFGHFDNGAPVSPAARRTYRDRRDLQQAFPNPYRCEEGLHGWLCANGLALPLADRIGA